MPNLRGTRLAGRASATVAAGALALAAVVLNGQASPNARLEAATGSVAPGDAPDTATITIEPAGFDGWAFTPADTALAAGGTLTVTNNTATAHTFTSLAIGNDGLPLFERKLDPFESKTIRSASTLADGSYGYFCRFHRSMTGTLTIGAGGPVAIPQRFGQRLVQPPRLHGKNIRIVMKRAKVRVMEDGPRTPMLTFGGTFPGPTIVRRAGRDTKVTFVNRLPRRIGAVTIHQHAGHQKSRFDGQPASHLIRHGKKLTYDYPLRDGGAPLPAALRFYHDHRMDRTARNNWFGLQGMFLTTDPHDARIGLPDGRYDVPLAVTERSFHADNRLTNPFKHMAGMTGGPGTETLGNAVLVNGRFRPFKRVHPGRYRLQILNSSLFSSYDFALSNGQPFTQIGTGSGLLPHPVVRQDILLGPAQRADVVVDFRKFKGGNIQLQSLLPLPGADNGVAIMQFRVRGTPGPAFKVPDPLARIQHYPVPAKIAKTWRFGLNDHNHWTINGRRFNPRRVDHVVRRGSTERWKLVNTSGFTHVIHLHEELWRTLARDGHRPPPWERGYEDTWRLDPGESVVVAARFADFAGRFMVHCHMLDHEDDGMMATFRVVK